MRDKNCPNCNTRCECVDVYDTDRAGDTLIEHGCFECADCGEEFVVTVEFQLVQKDERYE